MGNRRWLREDTGHLSDEQLTQFQDGELTANKSAHLDSCLECTRRLRDIKAAEQAYAEYQRSMCKLLLPPAPKPWLNLGSLIATHEEKEVGGKRWRWWPPVALAAGACLVFALLVLHRSGPAESTLQSAKVNELLAQSARSDIATPRRISVRAHGQTFIRPAVLTTDGSEQVGVSAVRAAFETARYSWREPLSARSFHAWRSQLKSKRDSVSVITNHDKQSYRVRTESSAGILRSASLTLATENLRPTEGSFEFEGLGTVDVTEADGSAFPAALASTPPAKRTSTEVLASPQDTLRVLAALDTIGADVGEPIDISLDFEHQHVVVHGTGLSADRQREVTGVLKTLPRILLIFDSRGSAQIQNPPAASERYSTHTPESLRQQLEERLGGGAALQEVTDRVLEQSSSSLAQAHAMQVLARAFPPDIESRMNAEDQRTLEALCAAHVSALEQLISQIRTELKPLTTDPAPSRDRHGPDDQWNNWQDAVAMLVDSAEETDKLLNRLLAGSYSQTTGEEMVRELPVYIARLDAAIRAQRSARR